MPAMTVWTIRSFGEERMASSHPLAIFCASRKAFMSWALHGADAEGRGCPVTGSFDM